mgnify:CR=1 FL=1
MFNFMANFCACFGAYGFCFGVNNERMGVLPIPSFGLIDVVVIALCFWDFTFTHSY